MASRLGELLLGSLQAAGTELAQMAIMERGSSGAVSF